MHMKKFVLVCLTLVLALGLLSGCGGKDLKDWDYIADKGTLVVGMTIFEPMNYYDGETLVGFDTELAQAVGEKLGVKVEFIEIDWENKVMELKSRNVDCLWNGMTILEDLKNEVTFSVPYSENYQACVINQKNADKYTDLASMAGARIGAEAGSAGEKAVKEDASLSTGELTSVQAQRNTLMELKAGTLDVGVIDAVMAKASVGEGTDYSDLMVVPGVELSYEQYGVGFRKEDTVTADKVNQALQELANEGFLDQLVEKYPTVMVCLEAN